VNSIWTETLDSFRDRLAGREPAPAGVTAAAVSATFALALLTKVLEITRNRKSFDGDPRKFDELIRAARNESQRLAQCADDDIAAFHEYLAGRPRQAIEVPLAAAQSAATGLALCTQAIGLIPVPLVPDLDAAATLLTGAARAMLFSIRSNLPHESDRQFREKIHSDLRDLETRIKGSEPRP
jgi:formiminotetrahydrofolate cyclodeaminase